MSDRRPSPLRALILAATVLAGMPLALGLPATALAAERSDLSAEAEELVRLVRSAAGDAAAKQDLLAREAGLRIALQAAVKLERLQQRSAVTVSATADPAALSVRAALTALGQDGLGVADLREALLTTMLQQVGAQTGDKAALRATTFRILSILGDLGNARLAADAHVRLADLRLSMGDLDTAKRSLVLAAQQAASLEAGPEQQDLASRIGSAFAALGSSGNRTVLAALLQLIDDSAARQQLLLSYADAYTGTDLPPLVVAIRGGVQAIVQFGEDAIAASDPTGPELAVSALGPDAGDAGVGLVHSLAARGKLFAAIASANLLPDGRDRAVGRALVAEALQEAGYTTVASTLATKASEALAGAARVDAATLEIIGRAFGRVATEEVIRSTRSGLPADRASAFLAASFAGAADADRFALLDAIKLIEPSAADPAIEQAADVRALVEAGRLDDALASVGAVTTDAVRTRRVLSDALLDAGRTDDAHAVITAMPAPADRLAVFAAVFGPARPGLSPAGAGEVRSAIEAALAETGTDPTPDVKRILARLSVLAGAAPAATGDDPDAASGQAEALALKGSFDAAVKLAQMSGSKTTLATVAVLIGKAGQPVRAGEIIAGIDDYQIRVPALRRIAEHAAAKLDRFGLLAGARTGGPAAAPSPLTWEPSFENNQILVGTAPYTPPSTLDALAIPDLSLTSRELAASVPYPNEGRAGVSLTGNNRILALGQFIAPDIGIAETLSEIPYLNAREYIVNQQKSSNARFIYVNSGTFTLEQLRRAVALSIGENELIQVDGDVYTLRAPLVIGPGGGVVLSGAEAGSYRFSVEGAAFIINAGRLDVHNTRLIAFDETTGEVAHREGKGIYSFRPFITSWSESETHIGGAEVLAFGFQGGKSYGLTFTNGPSQIVRRRILIDRPKGSVVDSSFDAMVYGLYTYEADDLLIIGNEYRNNIVYGIDPHDRSERLVIGYNTAYGSIKKHGIIVSREVNDSFIVGNLSFHNHGSGIMLDRTSRQNVVYANTAAENHQDGITLFESQCSVVAANAVTDNRRSGLRVRNSWDVLVQANDISGNRSVAVDIYESDLTQSKAALTRNFKYDPYVRYASAIMVQNRLAENGGGYSLAGNAAASFQGNQYVQQSKRLHSGIAEGSSVRLLGLESATRATGVSTACVPPPERLAHSCSFVEKGLIPANLAPSFKPNVATCEAASLADLQNRSN